MKNPTLIPKTLFSTDFYSPRDRMEAYRDSIGVVFDVDNINLDNREFSASLESYLLNEIMLVETETVAQNFFRTPVTLARNNLDHFIIQLFFDGFTAFKKDGEYSICDSSSLVVIDTSRPWYAFNPHFRHLSLVVPRRLIESSLWNYNSHHGRLLSSQTNPFVEVLENHILNLYQSLDKVRDDKSPKVMAHTVDLVISTLNYASYAESKKNTERHVGLRQAIIKNQCSLSRATLGELFSTEGLTAVGREHQLQKSYRKFSRCPDPAEKFLIKTEIKSPVFTGPQKGTSPHRLWEEWILAL